MIDRVTIYRLLPLEKLLVTGARFIVTFLVIFVVDLLPPELPELPIACPIRPPNNMSCMPLCTGCC